MTNYLVISLLHMQQQGFYIIQSFRHDTYVDWRDPTWDGDVSSLSNSDRVNEGETVGCSRFPPAYGSHSLPRCLSSPVQHLKHVSIATLIHRLFQMHVISWLESPPWDMYFFSVSFIEVIIKSCSMASKRVSSISLVWWDFSPVWGE